MRSVRDDENTANQILNESMKMRFDIYDLSMEIRPLQSPGKEEISVETSNFNRLSAACILSHGHMDDKPAPRQHSDRTW